MNPRFPAPLPPLPVDGVLPRLLADMARTPNAVLCAPPGAGKTTRVPLALLSDASWLAGRSVLMLEPRRLAAKNAARVMARLLGEDVGGRVGCRMRMESRVGPRTRIEVLTEGVLARLIQDDPSLAHVGCVIFDEFHERSLNADLGLALCLDVQAALRPDLRLLIMSATLDSGAAARLLGGCPAHVSEGEMFPVDVRYAPPPRRGRLQRMEDHAAAAIRHALNRHEGDVLAFLPGAAEIRRVEEALSPAPPGVSIHPLYGDLPPDAQDAAIAPCRSPARKVVLATAIAETSLTIEGVRVVVDAGLDRRAAFDPATGMGRLVTGRVSLAGAAQRAGRAGRVEPGIAYRLWAEEENAALRPFARPEILDADLAPLLLHLAVWGTESAALRWLDPPPEAALRQARDVLRSLDILDGAGRATAHGRAVAALPLHPRPAHMALRAREGADAPLACCMAALAGERLSGSGATSDIHGALARLCGGASFQERRLRAAALHVARLAGIAVGDEAAFFRKALQEADQPGRVGRLLALAWPEWLARRVEPGDFRLRCGRAASLPLTDPLAHAPFLGVAALDGSAGRARIRAASPLALEDVEELFAEHIENRDAVEWDVRSEAVLARRRKLLGALALSERPLSDPDAGACVEAALQGVAALGLHALPWTEELRQWQGRVSCMRRLEGEEWPDVEDEALLRRLPCWLGPFMAGIVRRAQFRHVDLAGALHALLPWRLARRLEEQAPTHVEVPSGSRLRIDYTREGGPALMVRLQEMFGCADTPRIAGGRLLLALHLCSPAGRPLQITRDLGGFWRGGYAATRAEMRGRYPRHPWPEDPIAAAPTRRAKSRGA